MYLVEMLDTGMGSEGVWFLFPRQDVNEMPSGGSLDSTYCAADIRQKDNWG